MRTSRRSRFGAARRLSLCLTLVLGAGCLPAQGSTSDPRGGGETLASLPLDAQYAISAALGLEERAYHARHMSGRLEVENPAQGLTAAFSVHGVDIRASGVRFGLALEAMGRGEALEPVAAAKPSATDNRIEYRRGGLTEWYVNGPRGLQQGFTVARRPLNSRDGALTLALAVRGGLVPVVDADARGLTLEAGDRTAVARYAGLEVFDADGKSLPARLERDGAHLLIRVEDAEARYPVTVDPFVERATLTASDGAPSDSFGLAAGISGQTIVVGAHNHASRGAAYVFEKPGTGWASMTETAKLTTSDGAFSVGRSVAISGDTILVGAYRSTAAYVFQKPATGWASMTETAKLTSSLGAGSGDFGFGVAISGDTIVVGAMFDPGAGSGRFPHGAAYVFEKPATGWASMTETVRLTSTTAAAFRAFGRSVGISGGTVVVGSNANLAYVFERPTSGWTNMTETAQLFPAAGGGCFGVFVSIDADTVVVGEPASGSCAGVAYVFEKPGTGWADMTETARLTDSSPTAGTFFGETVAISGDTVLVGAYGVNANQGAAYVFEKPVTGWTNMTETQKLTALGGVAGDSFGQFVALSSATIVVGARGVNSFEGEAYVFDGPPTCQSVSNSGCGLGSLTCNGSTAIGSTLSLAVSTCGVGSGQAILLGVPLTTPWSFPSSFACGGAAPCLVSCLPLLVLPGPTLDIPIPFNTSMIGGTFCLQGGCAALSGCFAFTDRADVTVTN